MKKLFLFAGLCSLLSGPAFADERCSEKVSMVAELAEIAAEFETATNAILDRLPHLRHQRERQFNVAELDLPEDARRAFHDFEDEAVMLLGYSLPDYLSRARILARELEACS